MKPDDINWYTKANDIKWRADACRQYAAAYRDIAKGHNEAARALRLVGQLEAEERELKLSEEAALQAEKAAARVVQLTRDYFTAMRRADEQLRQELKRNYPRKSVEVVYSHYDPLSRRSNEALRHEDI